MKRLPYILLALLVLSACVSFHELGHLIAAVAQGIPVETYSIGFGPALVSTEWLGITWQIASIPAGGYCSFPDGVDPNWIVAVAGPLFGFIFAMPFAAYLLHKEFGGDDEDPRVRRRSIALSCALSLCIPLLPIAIPAMILWIKFGPADKVPPHPDVNPFEPEGNFVVEYKLTTGGKEHVYKMRFKDTQGLFAWNEWIGTKGVKPRHITEALAKFDRPDDIAEPKMDAAVTDYDGPAKMGGPVELISSTAREMHKGNDKGELWHTVAVQVVMLCIGINIFNLIPIPPLDGGLALMDVIPMSELTHDGIYGIGVILFFLFFLVLTGADIYRLIRRLLKRDS